jgi:hypothetical protein
MVADRDDGVVVVKETKETKHAKNGPKNNPNPRILPHLGSPTHRLDATTIVDDEATAIDAANVEVTAIDATAIDAANVEATFIAATAIDAANVEATATAIDATAIPSPFHILGRWITITITSVITLAAHPVASVLLLSSTAGYYALLWRHLKEYLRVWFGLRAEHNNFEFMSACRMC